MCGNQCSFVSLSENLSEISGLGSALMKRDHIRVLPGKWKWSQDDQFPPLSTILETHFWKDATYTPIREMLRLPIPSPDVLVGGEFVTINVLGPQKTPPPNASQAAGSAEDLGTEVIDEGDPDLFASSSATAPTDAGKKESTQVAAGTSPFGLIHLVGMKPGSFVPATLKELPYVLAIVEVCEEDSRHGVHQLVAQLMNFRESLVVVLAGDPYHVTDAAASIQRNVARDQLKQTTVRLYYPAQDCLPYQMAEKTVLILSRLQLRFKVWFQPLPG